MINNLFNNISLPNNHELALFDNFISDVSNVDNNIVDEEEDLQDIENH